MPSKVTDYMTRKIISIQPDTGIREAFFLMKENAIRHLPVVENGNQLVGIVSDRELRRPDWVDQDRDICHAYYLDDEMSIENVMIKNVHVVHTYDTLKKAVKLILNHKIGALPVLDKTETLVGMLSSDDLLRALDDMISENKNTKKQKRKKAVAA